MIENGVNRIEFTNVSVEHFAEFLSSRYPGFIVEPHSGNAIISVTGIYGSAADLRYNISSSSGGYDIKPLGDANDIVFTFPQSGGMHVKMSTSTTLDGAATIHPIATIASEVISYHLSAKRSHTNLVFTRDTLEKRLATLFEAPIHKPLTFESILAERTGRFTSLSWMIQGVAQPDFAPGCNAVAAASFSDFAKDMLLELWPHNCSHLFRRRIPAIAPRQVKAAINYIHAHAHEALSAERLAQISGVSLRALQYAFRNTTGLTITDYHRNVRLQRAKDDIVRNPDELITDIATRWGFSNVGRFSRQFHEAFGERPADIRKRSR